MWRAAPAPFALLLLLAADVDGYASYMCSSSYCGSGMMEGADLMCCTAGSSQRTMYFTDISGASLQCGVDTYIPGETCVVERRAGVIETGSPLR